MRFLEGGLDIPDELLHRRDAGQVVFFCGAGVSKQAAGLLNFAELLDKVSTALGKPSATTDAGNDTATHSQCLSIDQQFTRLERLYLRERIEDLVTEFLRPRADLNPEIHKTLVDLARTTDGRLRLITSNFDHLFDVHTQAGQRYLPPNLPDFEKVDDFDGIVQLHGRLPDTDDRRSGAPLILSSIDFATAYLSPGKGAREFIHEILERYTVVFIGYTGNDVPISYILDGISRSERTDAVYAFAEKSEVRVWEERGVSTVAYNAYEKDHSELWDTLCEWAHYARDPHKWQQAVLRRAESGPQALAKYERGQIAYVVSTNTGAKLLGQFNLPATWLFVFDKHLRQAHTERQKKRLAFKLLLDNAADIDLSLESDCNTRTLGKKWDAFEPQPTPKADTVGVPKLSGLNTGDCPLSQRVHHILQWLFSNLSQRETLIWARFTPSLSATLVEQLTEHIVKCQRTMSPSTLTAWTYLIQAWRRRNSSHYSDMLFARQVSRSGLSTMGGILDFIVSIRPFPSHHPESLLPLIDFFDEPDPNSFIKTLQLRVGWPKTGFIDVSQLSPRLLETLFDGLLSNVGYAIELYEILGCESETNISTMAHVFDHRDDGNSDSNGVGYHFSLLTRVFERLLSVDHERASVTMTSLGTQSCAACAILKVWMLGQFANENPNLLGHELLNLDSRWFFCGELSTKIMDLIAAVWMQLKPRIRSRLEGRLASGCSDRPDYDRNVQKLGRFEFLKGKGVRLSQKANRLLTDLNREIPAKQSRLLSRCENPWLIPESEWSNRGPLPWTSISDVSSVSAYIQNHKNDEYPECSGFRQLCQEQRLLVFLALKSNLKRGVASVWGWKCFLDALDGAEQDIRLMHVIYGRLCNHSPASVGKLKQPIISWLVRNHLLSDVAKGCVKNRDLLLGIVIEASVNQPFTANVKEFSGQSLRDIFNEHANSFSGRLCRLLLESVRKGLNESRDKYLSLLELGLGVQSLRSGFIAGTVRELPWLAGDFSVWCHQVLYDLKDRNTLEGYLSCLSASIGWNSGLPNSFFDFACLYVIENYPDDEVVHSSVGEQVGRVIVGYLSHRWQCRSFVSGDGPGVIRRLLERSTRLRVAVLTQMFRATVDGGENSLTSSSGVSWFVQDVWPQLKQCNDEETSSLFLNAVLTDADRCCRCARVILPYIRELSSRSHFVHMHDATLDPTYSADAWWQLLPLLEKALPEDVRMWPPGTAVLLSRIKSDLPDAEQNDTLNGLLARLC